MILEQLRAPLRTLRLVACRMHDDLLPINMPATVVKSPTTIYLLNWCHSLRYTPKATALLTFSSSLWPGSTLPTLPGTSLLCFTNLRGSNFSPFEPIANTAALQLDTDAEYFHDRGPFPFVQAIAAFSQDDFASLMETPPAQLVELWFASFPNACVVVLELEDDDVDDHRQLQRALLLNPAVLIELHHYGSI
eukprot:m.203919 g.203919  ORF g.203919 m.203919 type:complete len:192 (+) comp17078_c0_seq1:708-1283(+)